MICLYDRVFCSLNDRYGVVSEIRPTGIPGVNRYRITFDDGADKIVAEAFCQPAPMPRGRASLRLATIYGREVTA